MDLKYIGKSKLVIKDNNKVDSNLCFVKKKGLYLYRKAKVSKINVLVNKVKEWEDIFFSYFLQPGHFWNMEHNKFKF